jgi:menaquinone-dependent protoporphyrinogen oxidase
MMNNKRRDFLKYTAIALASASAYSFGEEIRPLIDNEKAALIYGTRYGATKDTAQWIAKGAGDSVEVIDIENLKPDDLDKYGSVIIGSGIWIDGTHRKLMKLLTTHKEQIQPKIIASFIVCGTTGEDEAGRKRIGDYFEKFHKPLDVKPPLNEHFGGRMIIEKLTEKDRKLLENFYKNIVKKAFTNWDRTEPEKAEKFGARLTEPA